MWSRIVSSSKPYRSLNSVSGDCNELVPLAEINARDPSYEANQQVREQLRSTARNQLHSTARNQFGQCRIGANASYPRSPPKVPKFSHPIGCLLAIVADLDNAG
jgi:hypothetical protein